MRFPLAVDALETDARRDRPVAGVDGVVDVERMRLVGTGVVARKHIRAIVRIAVERRVPQRRVVLVVAIGLLVHRFAGVAIAHADLVRHLAPVEQLRIARLDGEGVVVARIRVQLVRVGAVRILVDRLDVAAAEAVGVISLHLEAATIVYMAVLHHVVGATTVEIVVRTARLERVGVVIGLGEAAGHAGLAVVVMNAGTQRVFGRDGVFRLQHHVVDAFVVFALAETRAMHTVVEQGHAKAVLRGAAQEQVAVGADAALVAALELHARAAAEGLGNVTGDEVDDAAHVLRSVAHGTAAAHDVHGLEVAQAHGRHGHLRLAVGRYGDGHAVEQDGGAGRQARGEAAHTHVQRYIAAARAVAFLYLHAGDATQRIAQVDCAGLTQLFAAHDGARTRMVLHRVVGGFTQPVAHHLDTLQLGRRRIRDVLGEDGRHGKNAGNSDGEQGGAKRHSGGLA